MRYSTSCLKGKWQFRTLAPSSSIIVFKTGLNVLSLDLNTVAKDFKPNNLHYFTYLGISSLLTLFATNFEIWTGNHPVT